jgi:glycosyltransferase involved in cell wall biosynthesis
MKTLSLVIPIWNEEKTLEILVQKVLQVNFPEGINTEIILVNDGSKDKSGEIMDELARKHENIKSYHNVKNSGKTQTVKNGLSYTTGDYVVIQDADLEYEPAELAEMMQLMIEKDLDVVYGNRFGKKNKVVYWQNYIGNRALSFFSNIFTYPRIKVFIPDMEVCYKMMRGDVARELGKTIESTSRFGLEPEITAKLSKYKINGKHLKFGVVPISYYPRTLAEGKKMNAINDGLKALKEIIQYNIFN